MISMSLKSFLVAGICFCAASAIFADTSNDNESGNLGVPGSRVSGGTRGIPSETAEIRPLAPPDGGKAFEPTPTLYWYLSRPVSEKLVLCLGPQDAKPVSYDLRTRSDQGVNVTSLADYALRLQPQRVYRWYVAEKNCEDNAATAKQSALIIAPLPEKSRKPLAASSDPIAAYAQQGYWYDAVHMAYRQLTEAPDNVGAKLQWCSLLKTIPMDCAIQP